MTILRLIKGGEYRHITPDSLHHEAMMAGSRLSLATVYNTLHEFATAGLVKHVAVGDRSWFCTNTTPHHHFYDEATGKLTDIPGIQPEVTGMPVAPAGMEITGVDVVVRVRRVA